MMKGRVKGKGALEESAEAFWNGSGENRKNRKIGDMASVPKAEP